MIKNYIIITIFSIFFFSCKEKNNIEIKDDLFNLYILKNGNKWAIKLYSYEYLPPVFALSEKQDVIFANDSNEKILCIDINSGTILMEKNIHDMFRRDEIVRIEKKDVIFVKSRQNLIVFTNNLTPCLNVKDTLMKYYPSIYELFAFNNIIWDYTLVNDSVFIEYTITNFSKHAIKCSISLSLNK